MLLNLVQQNATRGHKPAVASAVKGKSSAWQTSYQISKYSRKVWPFSDHVTVQAMLMKEV